MDGVDFLKNLPKNQGAQVGVLDIRTSAVERPDQIVERIRKAAAVVSPDKLTLSTDCGMKPLARMVAKMKLKALADAAKTVRGELMGTR
jgi:5-methyltetrahydropteroyltriglutamate--homocysteine methyltransferase